ncbi:MAG: NUDIX domain-containing protein [Parachlamydiaceae bacterium]|nr:NUDIX domain-containing protein [Parachlamydiaceae bacterium]
MSKIRHSVPLDVHLIIRQENKILLMRRHKTGFADGQYALVAGCHESDEPISSAIIREAKEEVGIDLRPEWLTMGCVMHIKIDNPGERVCFFFIANQWNGTITNCEPHKCDDLRFYPLEELPKNLIPFVRSGIFASLEGTHFVEM